MTDSESPADITKKLRRMLGANENNVESNEDDIEPNADDVQQVYQDLYEWMINEGKNPRRKIGLNEATAKNYINRLDQLHRFIIKYLDPDDPATIDDEDADSLLLMIDRAEITKQRGKNKGEEYGESTKRKFANTLESYFKWRYHEGEMEYEWEPKINFVDEKGESAYRFTYRELGQLLDAARTYGSLPSYYDTSDEKREEIDALVAQRLGIPKEDVTRNDWLHADWSGQTHSLITVSYDAGLTPIEVANAEVHWYKPKKKVLKIPTEFSCKERNKEEVGLADDAAESMSEWIQERRHLERYDGSKKIWLNREGNPYQSGSLCNLLRRLCEEAGIETEDRKIVWYSLRQTMGRNMTDEGDLSEANDQLRHDQLETTQQNYNQTPVEKLRARLNETHRKSEKAAANPEYKPYEEQQQNRVSQSTGATPQSTQSTDETNDRITPTQGGSLHVDAVIDDTPQARVDITRQILDNGSED